MDPLDDDRAIIVNYHYCQPPRNGFFSDMRAVAPAALAEQASLLRRRRRPVTAAGLLGGLAEGDSAGDVLLTFDDGTRDVYEHALPILSEHGVSAVLFCCTAPLVDGVVLGVQKIHMLQARLGLGRFRSAFFAALEAAYGPSPDQDPEPEGLAPIYRYDDAETRAFKFLLNVRLPYRVLDLVLTRLFEAELGSEREASRHIYMSRDEILRARDAGFTIGLHTHRHRMLSRLAPREQRGEIETCRDVLADILGAAPDVLSYPYGIAGTYDTHTLAALEGMGMRGAFTLGRRPLDAQDLDAPFELPRFDVNDVFPPAAAAGGGT